MKWPWCPMSRFSNMGQNEADKKHQPKKNYITREMSHVPCPTPPPENGGYGTRGTHGPLRDIYRAAQKRQGPHAGHFLERLHSREGCAK